MDMEIVEKALNQTSEVYDLDADIGVENSEEGDVAVCSWVPDGDEGIRKMRVYSSEDSDALEVQCLRMHDTGVDSVKTGPAPRHEYNLYNVLKDEYCPALMDL